MINVIGALSFAGFVLVGLAVLALHRRYTDVADRQRVTSALIGYVVIVCVGAGLTQRSLWPFASWSLMAVPAPRSLLTEDDWHPARIVGVTPDGREHRIDYRSWQPFSYAELVDTWLPYRFPDLPPDARDRVGAWLLSQANAARQTAIEGGTPGTWSRILGRLTAPPHFFHATRWSDPAHAPAEPFEGIRLYLEYFDVEARARDPDRLRLVLVYEYPR